MIQTIDDPEEFVKSLEKKKKESKKKWKNFIEKEVRKRKK